MRLGISSATGTGPHTFAQSVDVDMPQRTEVKSALAARGTDTPPTPPAPFLPSAIVQLLNSLSNTDICWDSALCERAGSEGRESKRICWRGAERKPEPRPADAWRGESWAATGATEAPPDSFQDASRRSQVLCCAVL